RPNPFRAGRRTGNSMECLSPQGPSARACHGTARRNGRGGVTGEGGAGERAPAEASAPAAAPLFQETGDDEIHDGYQHGRRHTTWQDGTDEPPVPERPQIGTVAAGFSEHRVSPKAGRRGAESRRFGMPSSGPTGRRGEAAQA